MNVPKVIGDADIQAALDEAEARCGDECANLLRSVYESQKREIERLRDVINISVWMTNGK